MTDFNNKFVAQELTIEEMDTVAGGDSAILQLAKEVAQAALHAGEGQCSIIGTELR
jgi:hypothetical protein